MIKEINDIIEVFRRRFPREAGWEVLVNGPCGSDAPSNHIHTFLKEARPDWIIKATTATGCIVNWNCADKNGVMLSPAKITSRLDPRGWTGEITLSIDGEQLIIQNFIVPSGGDFGILALFAGKTEKPVLKLFTQIKRWAEGKRDKAGTISIFGRHGIISEEPRPKLTWDDIILPGCMAQEIRANIEGFFKSGPRYKELSIPYKRGFLLIGPPGNGKTLIAKILASNRSLNFGWLKLTDKIDDDAVSSAFNYSYKQAPCVLLIEELDRLAGYSSITMANILNQLDGLTSGQGVLVLATSNAPEKLDPALINRPSRFDRIWRLGLPGEEQRLALLRRKGARFFSEEAMECAASHSSGFSMAYTQEILTNAMILAANAGQDLADAHLAESLAQIKGQYKNTWAREGLGKETDLTPMLGFAAA